MGGGVEKFKSLPPPVEPTIAAAASWLESAEAELHDHGLSTMDSSWPDFKDYAGKIKPGKGVEGDDEKEDEEDGGKKGKKMKGRKGKKGGGGEDPEPEPEAPVDASRPSTSASQR